VIGTPFDFQGFPLSSKNRSSRSKRTAKSFSSTRARALGAPARRAADTHSVRGSVVYAEVTPIEKEVVVAREIYASCEEAIRHSLDNLRLEGEIESDKLTGASRA